MKKFKLIEETQYMLTDETRSDKQLNAVDLNMLAILQFIKDGKASGSNWFNVLIKHPKNKWDNDEYTSVEKYFTEFGVKTDYTTLNRSINKLQRLGYISYKTGFYNNETKSGQTPRIALLKGTINLNDSNSECCSDIAIAKEKEKYKEKENKKHTYNLSTNKAISNTSDISTYIDKLELVNPTLYTLLMGDDDIEVLNYLGDNYSQDNINYIRNWWDGDNDKLQSLERFLKNF